MSIGEHVKRLRESRGLSLSELARRSHVNKSVLSRLENNLNKTGLSIDTLRALADGLGVPHGDLLDYAVSPLPSTIIAASDAVGAAQSPDQYMRCLIDLYDAVRDAQAGNDRLMNRES